MRKPKSYYTVEFKHHDELLTLTVTVPDGYASDDEEAESVACEIAQESDMIHDSMWRHADETEVSHHGSY